ncbi:MAG: Ig-like domain-containing protein [Xenococcaceae cyanobacterium MO_167.B27]|nr:Ig-like domain-containing protein [Xenococcaceae cyanobacterium MO_167.B27]
MANDTGISNIDRLTLDPRIEGQTTNATTLEARLDNNEFIDLTDALNEDGSFDISLEEYDRLIDGSFPDGEYTVEIRASNSSGQIALTSVPFTLDRTEPPITLNLAPESDTGELGDNVTTERVINLTGQTEPGSTVALVETEQEVTADSEGNFTFTDVPLSVAGAAPFTAVAVDAAGNQGRVTQEITREGINGAPIITSTPSTSIDTTQTQVYTYQLEADDPDGDELTYNILNAPDGTEIGDGGLLSFELPSDFLPAYDFTVEVSDGRGGTDSQTFTVATSDIFTGNGVIEGLKWNDLNGNGVRDTDLVQGANPDVVFVIDRSGSTSNFFQGTSVGDVNGDGFEDRILDAEIAGFIALNQQLINQGLGDNVDIGIVAFDSRGIQLDLDLATDGIQIATTPNADSNGNSISDVEEVLSSITFGGNTNFETALQAAENTFSTLGTESGEGNLIFVSDGQAPTSRIADELERLNDLDVNISAFGVGEGTNINNLRVIDPDAIIFNSTDELLSVFDDLDGNSGGTLEPGLAGVSIYLDINNNGVLDAGEPVEITAEDDPNTPDIDETGQYIFTNIAPDTYIVREVVPEDFEPTFPNPDFYTIDVAEDETVSDRDFGNIQVAGSGVI